MAGIGPAPKPKEQRRNRNVPRRGEWVDLLPLAETVLPALPEGDWSARTRQAWAAWSSDPVTGEYGPADIHAALDLAYLYEQWVQGKDVAAEVRQRQDRLGLNPKGKRDLRWRVGEEAAVPTRRAPSGGKPRARLSVVA